MTTLYYFKICTIYHGPSIFNIVLTEKHWDGFNFFYDGDALGRCTCWRTPQEQPTHWSSLCKSYIPHVNIALWLTCPCLVICLDLADSALLTVHAFGLDVWDSKPGKNSSQLLLSDYLLTLIKYTPSTIGHSAKVTIEDIVCN